MNAAVLLLAILADTTITIEPPDPTTLTPVAIVVTEIDSCPPPPVVTISGFQIDIALGTGLCLFPPGPITHRLELGILAAGTYNVRLTEGATLVATKPFTVLNANSGSFSVRPRIGPSTGGVEVDVFAAFAGTPQITFDGIPATNVTAVAPGRFRATIPAHAPGAVEVRVGNQRGYVFRYYDPAAAPLAALFERVLIPVIYNGPGAKGSLWTTDVLVRNPNEWQVPLWPQKMVAAQRPQRIDEEAPHGLFLFVPRSETLHFAATVRGRADAIGAEMPIVRENDFRSVPFELIDIPAQPQFRQTLRIYSPDAAGRVRVLAYDMHNGVPFHEKYIELTPSGSVDRPAFAVISDFAAAFRGFSGGPTQRVGLRIEPDVAGARLWAFVSVTDNDTLDVRLITPQ
jgi:hypothetical protein